MSLHDDHKLVLRRGADVHATDGHFGTLADVVIDPAERSVTHVVVAPDGLHTQPRLVPMWLVTATGDGLRIELDTEHVKQLQRVLGGDFVRTAPEGLPRDIDVRFKTVLVQPYFPDPRSSADVDLTDGLAGIPRDDFEIRCGSDVVSSNDRDLGHIVGFLVNSDVVSGMIVRSGLVGFQQNVIVPTSAIAEVYADMVILDLDRHQFRRLSTTTIAAAARPQGRLSERLAHKGAGLWYAARDRVAEARSGWG